MEIQYCQESEIERRIREAIATARIKKINLNIVPQFVGHNPRVAPYGLPTQPYQSLILMPVVPNVFSSTTSQCILAADPI